MKHLNPLALSALVALSACSGGSSQSGATPSLRSSASYTLAAYRMPLATGPVADKIQAMSRRTKTSYGGTPLLITDAPEFSAGDQVNFALSEVDALADGVAYPVIQYSSPVVVNVLSLRSTALLLGNAIFPAMVFDGIRFVIVPSQSGVVVNSVSYPATFGAFDPATKNFNPSPSASTVNVDVPMSYDETQGAVPLLVDFNVMESVALSGASALIGPAAKPTNWNNNAVIVGTILNAAGSPVRGATLNAVATDGSLSATSVSNRYGQFELHAIPGGSYSVSVANSHVSRSGAAISASAADPGVTPAPLSVSVPAGYRINLGTISD